MKHHVRELELRLGALSLRERALVLVVGLGLVFAVWDALILRPANVRGEERASTLETIETRLTTLRDTEARVRGVLESDPTSQDRQRETLLGTELERLNGRIHAELSELCRCGKPRNGPRWRSAPSLVSKCLRCDPLLS